MTTLARLTCQLTQTDAVLVQIVATQGSVPRETGTWMAVFPDALVGTIGGGHLEFQATALARAVLSGHAQPGEQRFALGPSLGQCCGGAVTVRLSRVSAQDVPRLQCELASPLQRLAVFGGGHVGRAIVNLMQGLPFSVTWIDSRDGIFPADVGEDVTLEHSDPVAAAVADLAPHSLVLVMSFSHAEDLEVVAACLQRQRTRGDLPFVGLIGSKTKWASFRHRLQERGFAESELNHVTCPIGLAGIAGKEPEVIAVAVAAQLLLPPRPSLRVRPAPRGGLRALGRPGGAQT